MTSLRSGHRRLADLIGSRLCHDLVNPLGAIGNGVELIEMTGSVRGPEMDADPRRGARCAGPGAVLARGLRGRRRATGLSAREARATAHAPWQGSATGARLDGDGRPAADAGQAGLPDAALRRNRPADGRRGHDRGSMAAGQWQLEATGAARVAGRGAVVGPAFRHGRRRAARCGRREAQFAALHARGSEHWTSAR